MVSLKTSVKESLDSQNFFTNLLTVLFIALNFNGAGLPTELPVSIIDAIMAGDFNNLIFIALPSLINSILKITRTGWSWGFWKTQNFWAQILTVLFIGLAAYGVIVPDNAVAELLSAFMSKELSAIIIALVINVVNPLTYIFFDKDKAGSPLFVAFKKGVDKFKQAA